MPQPVPQATSPGIADLGLGRTALWGAQGRHHGAAEPPATRPPWMGGGRRAGRRPGPGSIRRPAPLLAKQLRPPARRAVARVATGAPLAGAPARHPVRIATWLILPVVICLSQRLSHACLSISNYTAKLRMAHYISYRLFDSTLLLG